jgi:hypothetical protein
MKNLFYLLFFLFFIVSCKTTYGPSSQNFTGGYEDQLTGNNTAIVRFKSNAFTSMTDTQKFAMKRAAELTLERGFDYFLIEGNNVYEKNVKLQSQVSCYDYGYSIQCNEYGGGNLKKPRVELNIRMFKGNTPNQTGYYGAKEFLQYN